MKTLRIFNPEHDLALAFGGTNYTPPPMARLLRRDLQMLMAWIGDEGDSILSQDIVPDSQWINEMNSLYGMGQNVASVVEIPDFDTIIPWGWNLFMRRRLFLDGANENALPTMMDIENIRRLSHRRISIAIHQRFLDKVSGLYELTPQEFTNLDDVLDFARTYPCAYTKAPWSSSGKGIYRALDINGLDFTRWVSGIIKRQGSIMCERPLDAVLDFAMEFKCNDGKSEFVGYSVFNNDTHSSFSGGVIGSTDFLHHKVAHTLGNEHLLTNVRVAAIEILNELIAPFYNGYLGLDMMIYRHSDGRLGLNPCIELNLRTTMGVVSSIIGSRYLAEGVTGSFHVDFHKCPIPHDYFEEMQAKHPLKVTDDGKIKSGVQFLTPHYPDSQYCSYIFIP